MMKVEERLKKKGWKTKEIKKAEKILEKGEKKLTKFQKFLTHFSFFVALVVFLIGHFLGSFLLIPAFLLTPEKYLVFFLVLIGFSFGLLFELILINFENKKHHTIIAGIIVPLLVLLNLFYITNFGNNVSLLVFNSEGNHNPLFSSLTYVVIFVIPYLFHKISKTFK